MEKGGEKDDLKERLPILPDLLRYETFAVEDYGCMSQCLASPANSKIAQFRCEYVLKAT
jgi:hypothetical protein